jgi:hypothetical protein
MSAVTGTVDAGSQGQGFRGIQIRCDKRGDVAVTAVLAQHCRGVPQPGEWLGRNGQRRVRGAEGASGDVKMCSRFGKPVGSGDDRPGYWRVVGEVQEPPQGGHGAGLADR